MDRCAPISNHDVSAVFSQNHSGFAEHCDEADESPIKAMRPTVNETKTQFGISERALLTELQDSYRPV